MILKLDVSDVEFMVTKDPAPKLDHDGEQRTDPDGRLKWVTQVVATDSSGGEILMINTSGDAPKVEMGDFVTPVGLQAQPWTGSHGKHGISYLAREILHGH